MRIGITVPKMYLLCNSHSSVQLLSYFSLRGLHCSNECFPSRNRSDQNVSVWILVHNIIAEGRQFPIVKDKKFASAAKLRILPIHFLVLFLATSSALPKKCVLHSRRRIILLRIVTALRVFGSAVCHVMSGSAQWKTVGIARLMRSGSATIRVHRWR
jgi:hypothetical protein